MYHYQRVAAVRHCQMIRCLEENIEFLGSFLATNKYWSRRNGKSEKDFHFSRVYKGERSLKRQTLSFLESPYEGVTDTFYYGPLNTLLWEAIRLGPEALQTLTDLSTVLGVPSNIVEDMSDEELYALCRFFPDTAWYVFAYVIYRFKLYVVTMSDRPYRLKDGACSPDIYFSFDEIADFLWVYELDREQIYDMIESDGQWYECEGREERIHSPSHSLWVKTENHTEYPLGSYIRGIVDRSYGCPLTDSILYEREIQGLEIFWKKAGNTALDLEKVNFFENREFGTNLGH